MTTVSLNPLYRYLAFICTVLLIILCVLWELVLAPVIPGGSLMALKALPLVFPLVGLWRGNLYTMQWTSMLILLYLMEGIVRWYSDPSELSRYLGMIETILSMIIFYVLIMYLRPAKKLAKQRKKSGL